MSNYRIDASVPDSWLKHAEQAWPLNGLGCSFGRPLLSPNFLAVLRSPPKSMQLLLGDKCSAVSDFGSKMLPSACARQRFFLAAPLFSFDRPVWPLYRSTVELPAPRFTTLVKDVNGPPCPCSRGFGSGLT